MRRVVTTTRFRDKPRVRVAQARRAQQHVEQRLLLRALLLAAPLRLAEPETMAAARAPGRWPPRERTGHGFRPLPAPQPLVPESVGRAAEAHTHE